MYNYIKQPTDENICNSLISDSLGRNRDALALIALLNNLNQATTIAIEGDWGSGKTFFVKQIKLLLDSFFRLDSRELSDYEKQIYKKFEKDIVSLIGNGNELRNQISVYYDAWEHDDESDPLLSLIYSICVDLSDLYQSIEYKPEIMKAASRIAEAKTGIDFYSIFKDLSHKTDWLDIIKNDTKLKNSINEFFSTIYLEKADRIVVFIDELDRCKPTFAVELLERIKHYFNQDNVTFVFSINLSQLKHTIQRYYGNGFDGYAYLDRFFDLHFSLPKPNNYFLYRNVGLSESYVSVLDQLTKHLIEYFNMSIREAAHFSAMVNSQLTKYSVYRSSSYLICGLTLLPLAYALKIKNIDLYKSYVNGSDDSTFLDFYECYPNPFSNYLKTINEYFEEEEYKLSSDKKQSLEKVKLEDRLLTIYNSVFAARVDDENADYIVGTITIDRQLRDMIISDLSSIG